MHSHPSSTKSMAQIDLVIINIRGSDCTTMLECCWYSDMILWNCSLPLISAAIFQSLAPFKIYQCCDIFVLNDGLSPSLMKQTILWCRLRDAATFFWATSFISTSCLSTLMWHHMYLPLISAMEHPDMTCASVPGFFTQWAFSITRYHQPGQVSPGCQLLICCTYGMS